MLRQVATLDDYLKSFNDADNGQSRISTEHLEEVGVFPLRYHNPILADINILAAKCFWSGGLEEMSIKIKALNVPIPKDVLSRLQIEQRRKKNKTVLNPSRPYGRLLYLMGLPDSTNYERRKGLYIDSLPKYLNDIMGSSRSVNSIERIVTKKCMKDFVRVMLQEKYDVSKGRGPHIRLFETLDKETGAKLAMNVIDLMNHAYPMLNVSYTSINSAKASSGNEMNWIAIHKKVRATMFAEYFLFDEKISSNTHHEPKYNGKGLWMKF